MDFYFWQIRYSRLIQPKLQSTFKEISNFGYTADHGFSTNT